MTTQAKPKMFNLYVVRHGATEWSVSGQHTGRTDIPLTPAGIEQAECTAKHFKNLLSSKPFSSRFLHIYSSPLSRAFETARITTSYDPTAQIELDDDLQEWDYGAYEGRRTKEIQADSEETKEWQLFRDGCPGGESAKDVGARVDRFVAKIKDIVAREGNEEGPKDVLIFTHGHFARVLAARWDLPAIRGSNFAISTASVATLSFDHNPSEPTIKEWNSTGHLTQKL
ncbi:putative phosphoglycerate mutase [Powellomyces hirtus]|nr:putative phosphoglycerate mutase [Powellomyces hirtus]